MRVTMRIKGKIIRLTNRQIIFNIQYPSNRWIEDILCLIQEPKIIMVRLHEIINNERNIRNYISRLDTINNNFCL